jgi:enoyl-CoA hydratase/carnithine racemase
MIYQALNYQRKDFVMIIEILNPEGDLSKIARLSDELAEICEDITKDDEIRIVLLRDSRDKVFSSMGTGSVMQTQEAYGEPHQKLWSLAEPVAGLDRPVLAAVHGDAIGQGLELVLSCDMRIASEKCRFGFPQIKKGHIPCDGGTQRLSRLVGRAKALEMILMGEMIDAQEAFRIGLVNQVVSSEALMKAAIDMAREIAGKGPVALRYAKEAVVKGMDLTLEEGLRLEADLYLLIHTTRDRTEGIQAFRRKRTPRFEGR